MSLECSIFSDDEMTFLEGKYVLNGSEIGTRKLVAFARCFRKRDGLGAKAQKYGKHPGVYFLFGPLENHSLRRYYVGQAEVRQNGNAIFNRMNETNGHAEILDWEIGVMFVCTESAYLHDSEKLRYIEDTLYKDAKNVNHPAFRLVTKSTQPGKRLDDYDQDVLDSFIQFCKLFLKLAGFPIYCPEAAQLPQTLMYSDGTKREISEKVLQVNKVQDTPQISYEQVLKDEKETDLLSQPHAKTKVQEIYHHAPYGHVEAQLYFSAASGDYVLCAGAELKKLTTANPSTRTLRERYRSRIDTNNRTIADIHFKTRNQAALFVCGTETINANAYWKSSNELQKTNLPDLKTGSLPAPVAGQVVQKTSKDTRVRFYLRDRNGRFDAQGFLESDNVRFTVLAGSKLAGNPPGIRCEKRIKEKRTLFSLKIKNNILLENITFDKCSPAAEFVMYCSANGKTKWKDVNGISLGELQAGGTK